METKNYKIPAIVWLKVTDYMHGWLQWELGGAARIKDQKVVCVQDLPGARDVLRMETADTMAMQDTVGISMSANFRNCLDSGFRIDPEAMRNQYGVTADDLRLYVPIECPKRCMTPSGVLRPWGLDVNFGRQQAAAMQRLLREEFWKAVGEFNTQYAQRTGGKRYPAVEMIEAFCQETRTPDMYVEAMRREWQRRVRRASPPPQT